MCHTQAPHGSTPTVDRVEVEVSLDSGEKMPATLFLRGQGVSRGREVSCGREVSRGRGGRGILLVSDIHGPGPFYQSLAARLATAGFSVLLPDYFFRQGAVDGADIESARARRSGLDEVGTLGDLGAAIDWLKDREGGARVGILGFCMGGTFVLDLASMRDDLVGVSYYGFPVPQSDLVMPPPHPIALVDELRGPVLSFWGEDDHGVGLESAQTYAERATTANPEFEYEILPGLGHAFLGQAQLDDGHDAGGATWQRALAHFARHLPRRPTVDVAVGDYDHTRDLWNGQVTVPECQLECTVLARPEDLFKRFLEEGEWDAAEMSLSTVAAMRAQGDDSLVVLPVFPARSFRHGAIYVRTDGPRSPEELNGACIGIPAWVQTAGVFVRGMLAAEYGVDLASVEWIQAGVDEPGRREPVDIDLSAFTIRSAPDATLDELLLDGHVDAVISARPPASIERRDPRVRRLVGDWVSAEMDYYRRTRIFPIMHTLVLRRAVHERDPRIAEGLVAAFTEAKDRSVRRARSITVPSYPLAWAPSTMVRTTEVLGDDFWPYGIESSRPTLDAFLEYCHAQSITPNGLTIDELFAR